LEHNSSKKKRSSPGVPQRSSDERSEAERSGGTPGGAAGAPPPRVPISPDPEVPEKAHRRQYTAEYKLRILAEVERATQPGEIGQILRREGLYSSHLITWRRQRHEGSLSGLEPKKRGRKAKQTNPLARKLAESEGKIKKLEKRLQEAQIIIEFQKKVADLLGIPLNRPENEERD
jgi:transposase-like protein